MNIWVWKIRNNEEHSHVSGIKNNTFVYVVPDISVFDRIEIGALFLYDEIFVLVKSAGNTQNYLCCKRLLPVRPKSHTRTTLLKEIRGGSSIFRD